MISASDKAYCVYHRREPVRLDDVDGVILHGGVEDLVGVLRPLVVVPVLPGPRPQPLPVVEGQHRVGLHFDAAEEARAGERDLNCWRENSKLTPALVTGLSVHSDTLGKVSLTRLLHMSTNSNKVLYKTG